MQMMWTKRTVLMLGGVAVLAIAAVACGGGGGGSATQTPGGKTGTPMPTTAPSTGVPALDKTLSVVKSRDVRTLESLVRYTEMECVATANGAGGPPVCAVGETPGQRIRVLPAAQCEGMYLRPNEVLQALTGFTGDDITVYGVWRTPERYYPAGAYTIVLDVFPMDMPHMSREIIVSGDGIAGLNFGCGQTPA
jgi:hypothetical protein